jgi:DNA-binding LacI/PurR family transcriptional regulator
MRAVRRATISDVAAASGVGVGTVSRVINGAANVREATRQTVLGVIEELGYRPSHLAAALSRGTPRTVAIIVPHLTRPSTVERLAGALAVLSEQGYDTVVCNVDSPVRRDHFLADLTERPRVDGVIVMSLPMASEQLTAFRGAGVAVVTVDVSGQGVPQTITDDVAGGRLATAHLLALGHRRIGFVGDRAARGEAGLGFASSRRRMTGYRQELEAAGADSDPDLVRLGPYGPTEAAGLAAQLLALPDPPTAIFAASDAQAMGVLSAAELAGFPVPARLSVVGFDDIEAATLLGLSTVHQPLQLSGAEGARRLCALLRGEQVRPRRQVLPLRVMQRASSARPTAWSASQAAVGGSAQLPGPGPGSSTDRQSRDRDHTRPGTRRSSGGGSRARPPPVRRSSVKPLEPGCECLFNCWEMRVVSAAFARWQNGTGSVRSTGIHTALEGR